MKNGGKEAAFKSPNAQWLDLEADPSPRENVQHIGASRTRISRETATIQA